MEDSLPHTCLEQMDKQQFLYRTVDSAGLVSRSPLFHQKLILIMTVTSTLETTVSLSHVFTFGV